MMTDKKKLRKFSDTMDKNGPTKQTEENTEFMI